MFLNQFATAIFRFVRVMAAGYAKNVALRNITSVCAIAFYLFLLYTMTWDIGFADRDSVMAGRQKRNLWKGALISVCANIPNYVFAIFITMASLFEAEFLSSIAAFCTGAALILEGMYTGLLMNPFHGMALNLYWWVFFLLPIPAILTSFLAYWMGLKDLRMTKLSDPLIPESDRDPTSKQKTWTVKDDKKNDK
jgi:hypothetical protein